MPGQGETAAAQEVAADDGRRTYRVATLVAAVGLTGFLLWLLLDAGSSTTHILVDDVHSMRIGS